LYDIDQSGTFVFVHHGILSHGQIYKVYAGITQIFRELYYLFGRLPISLETAGPPEIAEGAVVFTICRKIYETIREYFVPVFSVPYVPCGLEKDLLLFRIRVEKPYDITVRKPLPGYRPV
jgi:hypothetical protein